MHSAFGAGYVGSSNGQLARQAASMKCQQLGNFQNRNLAPPVTNKVSPGGAGGAAGQAKITSK